MNRRVETRKNMAAEHPDSELERRSRMLGQSVLAPSPRPAKEKASGKAGPASIPLDGQAASALGSEPQQLKLELNPVKREEGEKPTHAGQAGRRKPKVDFTKMETHLRLADERAYAWNQLWTALLDFEWPHAEEQATNETRTQAAEPTRSSASQPKKAERAGQLPLL
ncbi:MAG: hypothetical protein HW388_959 [Dehalococcoidia bacterium]|nr:hypothetical protein [Dehalococcoidia bacterium]